MQRNKTTNFVDNADFIDDVTLTQNERNAALRILRVLRYYRQYHLTRPIFKMMRQQKYLVLELVETEKNYVQRLEICVNCFLRPLQALSEGGQIKVTKQQLKDIFINIEQIINFHRILADELEDAAQNWTVHS
ncbi:MAG: hypothetical protein EZS28_049116 [Streblomastix strix]|uniref:DH domain-containing protein n=1 Tax=Streblomastix strix TaxID=222440 RepID=A0A5J4TAT9_9EUKA|nr:MAG: hypothetical protein EZS28_049116 [Streblomastix strix]